MAAKTERKRKTKKAGPIVRFEIGGRIYEIDPEQRKVYQRFVEIETSRAAEIFSVWRDQHATV